MSYSLIIAKLIPAPIRSKILELNHIKKAVNNTNDPSMEYLFDAYEEFIDLSGEFEDWTCGRCRQHILDEFKKIHPFLIQLENEAKERQNTKESSGCHKA